MNLLSNLFRITSAMIFVQLLLGGLVTFDFIEPLYHIVVGIAVSVFAVATMVTALSSKLSLGPLRGISIGMVVLIIVQIILGFETLRTNSPAIAWVHFAVAMGIYAMSVAGSVMAFAIQRRATSVSEGNPIQSSA